MGGWIDHFPDNFLWSNATIIIKGMVPYGVVSAEEIDRVCERLSTREGEPAAWWEEWNAMGRAVEARAEEAVAEDRQRTAGSLYMRAAHYYYTGERFMPPGPEKKAASQKSFDCFHAGIRRRYPQIEFVEIPYEGTSLPALFFPAANVSGPAPTVVVYNGMDNCKEMSIVFAGTEFSQRGFNTICVDGPGQGEMRRLRDVPARYDFEVAGIATYDYLLTRPDVDPRRVVVMGYSFGGYYTGRIAAKDKRYAACVAMSALHWDLAAWQQKILDRTRANPKSIAQSNFQWQWVVNASTPEEAIEIAKKFTLKDLAKDITQPFLVTHGGNDRLVPVESAHLLYEAVGSTNKTIKIFSTEEGGAEHCSIDFRPTGIDYIADWIEKNV